MDREELKKRTKDFAHRCVKLALALSQSPLGDHIRKQLIKCSTSVAANYRAALRSRSSAEFYAKLCIVVEEMDETLFWLEMIQESNIDNSDELKSIKDEATELLYIFSASRKTAKNKIR